MSQDNRGQPPKHTMMGWNGGHARTVPAEHYRNHRGDDRATTDAETIVDDRFQERLAADIAAGRYAPGQSAQNAQPYQPAPSFAPPPSSFGPPQPQSFSPPQPGPGFGQPPYGQGPGYPQQGYGQPPQSFAPPQPPQGFTPPYGPGPGPGPAPGPYGYGPPPQYGQPPYAQVQQHGYQGPPPNAIPGPQNNYGQPFQQPPQFASPDFAQGTSPERHNQRSIPSADATAGQNPRVRFMRLTYLHLFLAIGLFAGLEYLFLHTPLGTPVQKLVLWPMMKFGGRAGWGIILVAFVGGGYLAERWANSDVSKGMQYVGLGFYTLLEALIFIPLLLIAEVKAAEYAAKYGSEAHFIRDAAVITMALFAGLTASVFLSKKDFSFLRSGLFAGAGVAAGLIVMSLIFGFQLGMVFSAGMIVLAGGYVLYYTSQVLAHYRPTQHVAAALALFSALALMFWYVIRILMKMRE